MKVILYVLLKTFMHSNFSVTTYLSLTAFILSPYSTWITSKLSELLLCKQFFVIAEVHVNHFDNKELGILAVILSFFNGYYF